MQELQTGGKPGEYTYLPVDKVLFGAGSLGRLLPEVERIGAQRVLIVTGKTLATKTPLISRVEMMLGTRHAATYSGIREHAPEDGIDEAMRLAIDCKPDMLVSVGGGSPIDAAKIIAYRMARQNFGRNFNTWLSAPNCDLNHTFGCRIFTCCRIYRFRHPVKDRGV